MPEENTIPQYNDWVDAAVKDSAIRFMQATEHHMIGTPHLLLGILKGGPAANLLIRSFGVQLDEVTLFVKKEMSKPLPQGIGEDYPYTDGAIQVLNEAASIAATYQFAHRQVYTDHLLAALIIVNDDSFAQVLDKFGIDRDNLMEAVMKPLKWTSELVKS